MYSFTVMHSRCPACETVFEVSEEALHAASGMVQCGVCQHVFNAESNRYEGDGVVADAAQSAEAGTEHETPFPFSEMPAILAEGYQPVRPPAPWWSTLFWTIAILVALIAVLTQMAWFNINRLARQADLKPLVEMACEQLPVECPLEKPRDLTKLELLSRDVRSHPAREGALLITTTFINRADFAQPYPMIELLLSNLTGETIAMRRFTPAEYLKGAGRAEQLMQPDVPATMIMEVADPGKSTVSYRFDFL